MRLGRYEDAAHYAADGYARHPHTLAAATVARAAGALGDQATAIGWLRTAAEAGTSPSGLATIIDSSPELIGIRQHPDVVAIRRDIAPRTPCDADPSAGRLRRTHRALRGLGQGRPGGPAGGRRRGRA